MDEDSRSTSHPSRSVSPQTGSTEPGDVAAAAIITQLQRVIDVIALFTSTHPAVATAGESFLQTLRGFEPAYGPLRLGVLETGFTREGRPLGGSQQVLEFAERLQRLLVVGLVLQSKVEIADLVALTECLSQADRDPAGSKSLPSQIESKTHGRIVFIGLTSDQWRFTDGHRPAGSDHEHPVRAPWAELLTELLSVDGSETASPIAGGKATSGSASGAINPDMPPQQAAARMAEMNAFSDPERLKRVRARLGEVMSGAAPRASSPAEVAARAQAASRARELVASMSPHTRMALLQSERETTTDALRVLAELDDALPTREVIEALESIVQSGARPTRESLHLFGMIAKSVSMRCAADGQEDRARWSALVERWSTPAADATIDPTLRESLKDVLSGAGSAAFTPEDYQSHLDYASTKLEYIASKSGERQLTVAEMREHAALVACELLASPRTDENPMHGSLQAVVENLETLLSAHNYAPITQAAHRATTMARDHADAVTRKAAEALVQAVTSPAILSRVMASLRSGEADPSASSLLALSGIAAIRAIILDRTMDESAEFQHIAADLIAQRTTEELALLIADLCRGEPEPLRRLVNQLGKLRADQARTLLEPLHRHSDDRLRRDAYAAMAQSGAAWTDDLLIEALSDAVRDIQHVALDKLQNRPDGQATRLMASFLSGRVGAAKPDRGIVTRAVSLMLERDDAARQMLCEILVSFSWRRSTARRRCADEFVKQLKPFKHDRRVRAALRTWTFSPAGVSLLLRGAPKPQKRRAA